MDEQIQSRKDEHIRVCLEKDVSSGVTTGLGGYRLEYDALPDLDLEDVDLSVECLGKHLNAPIFLGAMTGGSEHAGAINRSLARVAGRMGLAMALGSQRSMLRTPALTHTYDVRKESPEIPLLIGNIGAIQLMYGVTTDDLCTLVESVKADALAFHLNPLQEAIQPEGDTRFKGLFSRLQKTLPLLPFPCLLKEVGAGISQRTAQKVRTLPLAGIEASGVGGTSWARVEGYRSSPQSHSASLGEALRAFGTPTAESIVHCRQAFPEQLVIASGGIRTGMDIAVAIALGADAVAIARPVLEAVMRSEEALETYFSSLLHELRVICFCTNSPTLQDLANVRLFSSPPQR